MLCYKNQKTLRLSLMSHFDQFRAGMMFSSLNRDVSIQEICL